MALLDFFLSRNKHTTASIAKERLQIIVAERRLNGSTPKYLPKLKKEILQVLCKYINVTPNMIKIQLDKKKKNMSVLELNVTFSE
ncbi:MAG: cell division topological specificity factor MinE [Buchnera aphidicola (Chaetogeoica yunlongensis)]